MSARALPREPAGGTDYGRQPARTDREHLILGGTEAHRECRLWGVESRDRQDDRRYGHRIAALWITAVSLYPGLVRTEKVMEAAAWLDLTNSESPEFIGRAVAALAGDPHVMRYTGTVLVAASLAGVYGFTDIDGKAPRPLTLADV
jgi:hypothetical protein